MKKTYFTVVRDLPAAAREMRLAAVTKVFVMYGLGSGFPFSSTEQFSTYAKK